MEMDQQKTRATGETAFHLSALLLCVLMMVIDPIDGCDVTIFDRS
jgi:hypothetical protein